MNSKTDLALIYYMSTINKRINKNLIQRLNINEALNNIIEQPYAMRLYSYLLKGIVRIYLLKYKYYQNEVNALLEVLKFKNTLKIKNKNIEDKGYILGINNKNNAINEFCISNNISEIDVSNENSILNNDPSFICDPYFTNDPSFLADAANITIYRKKPLIDIEIECENTTSNVLKIKHIKLQDIKIKMYPILEIVKGIKQKYFDDVESLEYIRHVSSNIFHTSTMQTSTLNISSNIIQQNTNYSQCNDSYCVSVDTKYDQASEFYELLVKLSRGEVKAYQMSPYSEIEVY